VTAVSGNAQWSLLADQASDSLQRHRNMGNLAPWIMGAIVLVRGHLYISGSKRVPEWIWIALSLVCAAFLVFLAHQGGWAVYRDGMGVELTP